MRPIPLAKRNANLHTKPMTWKLDVGAGPPRTVEWVQQVTEEIPLVLMGELEFLVLDSADGSYVQTTSVHDRLVAEWRACDATGNFRHYKLQAPRAGGDQRRPPLPGAELGYREDELLDVEQVADVIGQFMTNGSVGEPFKLDDITHWFEAKE